MNRTFSMKRTVIVATLIAMVCFCFLLVGFSIAGTKRQRSAPEKAYTTVIPAPTLTPTSHMATAIPATIVEYVSAEGFAIGAYVRIANTQGTGLKVRPNPGTSGLPLFIALDGEIYQLLDGPDDSNGYQWWKLESMDDAQKNGWAAADFLELVAPPAE